MKKIYRLSALLIILTVIAAGAAAADPASSGRTVILPASLETIEEEAFRNDKSLETAVLPEGIKAIFARAFADSGLTEIHLPASLEFIDDTAFSGLTEIVITADAQSYAYYWAVYHGYIQEPEIPGDSFITIATPPEPPGTVTASGMGPSTIEITWSKSPSKRVDRYEVRYSTTSYSKTSLYYGAYGPDATSARILGLKAMTKYYFWVQAVNDAGASELSNACSSSAWTLYN